MLIKGNAKKLLASTLLFALFCASMVSMALAAPEDNRAQAADSSAATEDGQKLIAPAPQDDPAPTASDNPVLIQQRDGNTNTTDNSSANPTDAQPKDEGNLIATNTATDNTAVIIGTSAVAMAILVIVSIIILRRPKK
jgi:hypothetical protein